MKFSIIVPTYNRSSFLPICITSLRNQKYPDDNYEIIVVDNNSTDDTTKVVEELNKQAKKNIQYILEKRPGLMYARHAGAWAAKNEILVYTDDDAIAEPQWLAELAKVYDRFQPDCVGGKILIKWDLEPPKWVIPFEGTLAKLDHGSFPRLLNQKEMIYGANFSIYKSRLFQIGGFNPDQIGNILVGDGEAGLCKRIHMVGWKMGWAPSAIVWHYQVVAKNATLQDMQRRYANNGVCEVYTQYKTGQVNLKKLRTYTFKIRLEYIKKKIIYLLFSLFNHHYYCKYKLLESYFLAQIRTALRLLNDSEYRDLVEKEDWINSE